jgi:hypothetical protein
VFWVSYLGPHIFPANTINDFKNDVSGKKKILFAVLIWEVIFMKKVLITGGAGGLGFASAKYLADRGCWFMLPITTRIHWIPSNAKILSRFR